MSGCQTTPVEKTTWTLDLSTSMSATVDGLEYPCTLAGASGLIYQNGNNFGFRLNPRVEDTWEPVSVEGLDS